MSKIHQPLPRTPRQSQQLLALLNRSFQHQLDIVHPPINGSQNDLPSLGIKESTGKEHATTIRPFDQHVNSLLELPVFNVVAETRNTKNPGQFDTHPALEEDVLSKRGSPELVIKCLKGDENIQMLDSRLHLEDAAQSSGKSIAIRVAELIAQGSKSEKGRLLGHNNSMRRLTRRLIDEGHSSIAWGWLKDIFSEECVLKTEDNLQLHNAHARLVGGCAILNTLISRHASQGELYRAIDEYLIPLARTRSPCNTSIHSTEDVQLNILRKGIRLTFKFIVYHGGFGNAAPRHFEDLLKYSVLIDKAQYTMRYHQWALLLYHPSPGKASPVSFCYSPPNLFDEKQPPVTYFTNAYGAEFALSLIERAETLLLQDGKREKLKTPTRWLTESDKARSKANRPPNERFRRGQGHARKIIDMGQFAVA